jgi:hypothetical protein
MPSFDWAGASLAGIRATIVFRICGHEAVAGLQT